MDKQYFHELEAIYKQQMEEIDQGIEKEVRAEFQGDLNRVQSQNSQANFWNSLKAKWTNFQQAEQDAQNTQQANQNRMEGIERRIAQAKEERSKEASTIIEASIYEDFGGSRETALEQYAKHEEEQKAQVKGQAQGEFNVSSGAQEQKQEQIKNKAQWQFNMASGRQEQKLEEINGQTKEAFQEVGQQDVEMEETAQNKEQNEVTLEMKASEQEKASPTLDTAYWKKAEQVEAQMDTSNLITTPKESTYDAKMAARISQSFETSKRCEQSY